jgi:hypothetical protein
MCNPYEPPNPENPPEENDIDPQIIENFKIIFEKI